MAKVVIYARVSTQGQDYERQLAELREYARKMEYEVVMEFCEKVSGAKTVAERQALTELLSFVESNKVDKVLIYECSRLSRRAIDFLTVIENLTAKKISVYILQNGLETLQDLLFPNGILWDKDKDNYRTFDENEVLSIIARLSVSYKNKKEENSLENSSFVQSWSIADSNRSPRHCQCRALAR